MKFLPQLLPDLQPLCVNHCFVGVITNGNIVQICCLCSFGVVSMLLFLSFDDTKHIIWYLCKCISHDVDKIEFAFHVP